MPVIRCQNCASKFSTDSQLARHIGHKKSCEVYYNSQSDSRKSRTNNDVPVVDDTIMDFDLPSSLPVDYEIPSFIPDIRRSPSISIEDIEGGHECIQARQRYAKSYPQSQRAGETFGRAATQFERMKDERENAAEGHWAPFESQEEYELAEWLIKNVNQRAMDDFLKLPIVSPASLIHP